MRIPEANTDIAIRSTALEGPTVVIRKITSWCKCNSNPYSGAREQYLNFVMDASNSLSVVGLIFYNLICNLLNLFVLFYGAIYTTSFTRKSRFKVTTAEFYIVLGGRTEANIRGFGKKWVNQLKLMSNFSMAQNAFLIKNLTFYDPNHGEVIELKPYT